MKILEIKNLYFKYDKQIVLENINLNVENGDFLAIIGPNGGGKSTLIKLIISLLTPTKGEIKLYKKDIGYVPQNTNINIQFPIQVKDVVSLGFKNTKETRQKVINALEKVDMINYQNSKISNLSGGQRQKVFIARALFNNPSILVLDEPTANIDVKGQENIYQLLKKLNKKKTIIMVSHDISVILKYATKVAYINKNIYMHKVPDLKNITKDEHFCEVELMSMLENCSCKNQTYN